MGRHLRESRYLGAMLLSAILCTSVMALPRAEPTSTPTSITVFAAASLKEPFEDIGKEFERANSHCKVRLAFAGSQQLAIQIKNGAPADIFASADWSNMEKVADMLGAPTSFATNRLAIVTPPRLKIVKSLKGLALAKNIVVAAEPVPAGKYTATMLETASKTYGQAWLSTVRSHVVSREQDVRSVLAKVQLGEADAGVVYVTDARSAKDQVRTVTIPDDMNPVAMYPVAVVKGSKHYALGRRFVQFLVGKKAQAILRGRGFGPPSKPK